MEQAYTADEIREHATDNLPGFTLKTLVFLRQRGTPWDEWVGFIQESFAPGWEEERGTGAVTLARKFSKDLVSFGGELRSRSGDDEKAEFSVAWPPKDQVEWAGLSWDEVDFPLRIKVHIAQHLGLRAQLSTSGDERRLVLNRE